MPGSSSKRGLPRPRACAWIRPPCSLGSSAKRRPCGPWPTRSGLEFVDLVDAEVDLSLLKDFPSRFIHRESLFPIRRNNGMPDRRHERSLQLVSAGRVERGHRLDRGAGAGQPRRDRQANQDPPGRRQRNDRRSLGGRPTTASSSISPSTTTPNSRRWPRSPRWCGWSTRSCWRRSSCGPATYTSNRSTRACGSATASTACCTPSRCRRRSTASRPRSSAV